MAQCCDREDVTFTLAFLVPGSPRVPADGAPIEAYFDNIVVAGPGFEMDHPIISTRQIGPPLGEPGDRPVPGSPNGGATLIGIEEGALMEDEDECEKPQLAFGISVILSGA